MLVTPPLCSTKSMFCSSWKRLIFVLDKNFQLSLVSLFKRLSGRHLRGSIICQEDSAPPEIPLGGKALIIIADLILLCPTSNQQPATRGQRVHSFPPSIYILCSSCTLDGSIKIQLFFVYSPPLFLYLYSSCTRYGSVKIQFFFFFNSRSQHLL